MGYVDVHRGEPIDAECPHCRLPIYRSDPRRLSHESWDGSIRLYHSGCASSAEAIVLETRLQDLTNRLRGCGYTVDLRIIRPVR